MNHEPLSLSVFINPEHAPGDNFATRMSEHIEQVSLARSLGYDGVAIGHHMALGSSVWFPPMETLVRLVPAAEGMSMATCMLVLPLFHPLHVAQQAVYLDLLTNGRFTLGVAPGWQRDEFEALDISFKRRIRRFTESIEIIRQLWSGEAVNFAGQHFSLSGEKLAMVPIRKPRPAMWFGGSVPAAVERIAGIADSQAGDSWVASSHIVGEKIAAQAGLFNKRLTERGVAPPAEFPILRNIVVAQDRETALRDAGPALEASYRTMGQAGLFTRIVGESSDQLDLERLIKGRVILGSPEEVATELKALRDAIGFNRLIARVQWMGLDQRSVLRTIELLAKDVLPRLNPA